MFNKLFSRTKLPKKSITGGSDGADLSSMSSNKKIISDKLADYRSDIFPDGIIAICLSYKITETTKTILIELLMPFPCIGELTVLANTLSTSLTINVQIKVALNITAVRKHELKNIKNIIAVASGKGGVGKSTTAVNLAYGLMVEGASVGILDADIYGPSIPTLLGLKNIKPTSTDGKLLTPLKANGLVAMSLGFLVPENDATVWRGPMASSAFNQLLTETAWPELDYLIVDMPPGTGDIQLTLAQKVPVAAAIIVTTPQDLALVDAVKGIAMFEKVNVPVLGVIENMSYHQCEKCGHQSPLFGQDGGKNIAKQAKTTLLGQLPLDITIRQDADLGICNVLEKSESDIAQMYRKIARNTAAGLYNQLDARSPQTAEIAIKIL